jgi:hypothetical protein
MFDPPETKKRLWVSAIAFSGFDLPIQEAEIKKAMGAWKPPMAFVFNSNNYSSTGQASFMFAQRHQFPCVVLKTFFTAVLFSIDIHSYLTNPPTPCQVFLRFQIPILEIVMRVKRDSLSFFSRRGYLLDPVPVVQVRTAGVSHLSLGVRMYFVVEVLIDNIVNPPEDSWGLFTSIEKPA